MKVFAPIEDCTRLSG